MNQEVLKNKQAVVSEVLDSMKAAKSVIVVEYRGLTVATLMELRHTLKAVDATFGVYKNSLVERAADSLGYTDLHSALEGPNGYIFSKDVIAGPKAIIKFARKYEKLVIKGGVVEGKVVNADGIKTVASLPGREGLISMFLSCLQAPVRQFACTVQAIADKAN